jgi:dephospho-CoA kinase
MSERARNGIVLGLVGPVCAGKSEVSRLLRRHGAEIYEADAVVRKLYEQPDVKQAVRRLFGDDVFDETGAVNRTAVATRVFGDSGDAQLRRALTEQIIFPRTGQVMQQSIDSFRARAAPRDVLVLDAPTLIEAGRPDWCDRLLLVTAPLQRRLQWAAARGWPAGEVQRRDAAMLPEAEKRRLADYVIDNTGTLADLGAAVDRLWRQLQQAAP